MGKEGSFFPSFYTDLMLGYFLLSPLHLPSSGYTAPLLQVFLAGCVRSVIILIVLH